MATGLQRKVEVQYDSVIKASKALEELRTKFNKGEITQKEYDKSINKVEKSLNKVAKSIDQVSNSLDKAGDKTKGMVNGFADLKAGFDGVMAGFNKLKQAVGGTIDAYVQFEKKSKEVQTLGVDDKTIKKIESDLKKVAQDTGKTYEDLWKGTYDTISSGAVSAADSVELVGKASKFAIGAVTDTGDAVGIVAKAINAFGMEAKDTDLIFNVLQETIRNGVTTGKELSQFLPEVFALSNSVGLGIKDMGVAITGLTKGGFSTNTAVTGLKAIETAVLTYGDKLEKAGVQGVDFTKGQITNFQQFIKSISALPAPDILKLVGSSEAVSAIGALGTQIGAAWVDSFEDVNLAGSFEKAFGLMEETTAQKMAKIKAQFETVLIETGESMMPVVEQIMKALKDLMPTIKQFGQIAATVLNEVGRYFGSGGWLFGAILLFKKMGIGFDTFKDIFIKGIAGIKVALAGNPLGLLITAATALIPLIMSLNRSNAELAEEASNAAQANLKLRDSMNAEVESLNKQKQSIAETITKLKEHQYLVKKYQGVADRTGITDELKIRAQEALATIRQSASELGGTSRLAIENLYTAAKDGSMKVEDALNKAIEVYQKAQGIIDKAIGENQKMADKFTVAGGMAAIDAVSNALIQRKQLEQELDQAQKDGNKGRIAAIAEEQAKIVQTYESNKNVIVELFKQGGDNAKQISDYLQKEIQGGLFKTLKDKSEWIKAWDFGAAISGDYSKINQDINNQYDYTLDILKQLKDEGYLLIDQGDELVAKYGEQADAAQLITGADLERLATAKSITDVQYAQLQAQADTLAATILQLDKENEILNTKLQQINAQTDILGLQRLTALSEIASNKSTQEAAKTELEAVQAILKSRKTIIKTITDDKDTDTGGGGGADKKLTDKDKKEREKKEKELEKKREKEEEEKKKREEELTKKIEKFHDDMMKQQEEAQELAKKQIEEQIKARDAYREAFKGIDAGKFESLDQYRDEIETEYAKQYDAITKDASLDERKRQDRYNALADEYKYFMWKSDYQFKSSVWELQVSRLKDLNNELVAINKQYNETLHPIDASIEKFREASKLSKEIAMQVNMIVGKDIYFYQDLKRELGEAASQADVVLGKLFGITETTQARSAWGDSPKEFLYSALQSGEVDIRDVVKYLRYLAEHKDEVLSGSHASRTQGVQDRAAMVGGTTTRAWTPGGVGFQTAQDYTIAEFIAYISNVEANGEKFFQDLYDYFNITEENRTLGAETRLKQRSKSSRTEDDVSDSATYIEVTIDPTKYTPIEQIIATITGFDPHDLAGLRGSKDYEEKMKDFWDKIEIFLYNNIDSLSDEGKKLFYRLVSGFVSKYAEEGIFAASTIQGKLKAAERNSAEEQQKAFKKLKDHVISIDFTGIQDELTRFVNINVEELQTTFDNVIEAQQKGIDPNQLQEMKLSSATFADRTLGIVQSVANMSLDVQMTLNALDDAHRQISAAFNNQAVLMAGWEKVGDKLINTSTNQKYEFGRFNEFTGAAYDATGKLIADNVVNVTKTNEKIDRADMNAVVRELEKKYAEAQISFEKLQEVTGKIVTMIKIQTGLILNDVNQVVAKYKGAFQTSLVPELGDNSVFQQLNNQITQLETTREAHQKAIKKMEDTIDYEKIINKKMIEVESEYYKELETNQTLYANYNNLRDQNTEEENAFFEKEIALSEVRLEMYEKQFAAYEQQKKDSELTPEEIDEYKKGIEAEKEAIEELNFSILKINFQKDALQPLKELNEYLAKFGLNLSDIGTQVNSFADILIQSTAIQKAQNIVEAEKLSLQQQIIDKEKELLTIQAQRSAEKDVEAREKLDKQYQTESKNLDDLKTSLTGTEDATKVLNQSSASLAANGITMAIKAVDKYFDMIVDYVDQMNALSVDQTKNLAEKSGAAISGAGQFASDIPVVGEAITAGFSFIGGLIEWIGGMYETDYEKQMRIMEKGIALNQQQLAAINRLNDKFEDELEISNVVSRDQYNTAKEQLALWYDLYPEVQDNYIINRELNDYNWTEAVNNFLNTDAAQQTVNVSTGRKQYNPATGQYEDITENVNLAEHITYLRGVGRYGDVNELLESLGINLSDYLDYNLTEMTDEAIEELRKNYVKQREGNQDLYDYWEDKYYSTADEDDKAEAEQWMNFYKNRIEAFQSSIDIIDAYYEFLFEKDELDREQLQDELDRIDRDYDLIKAKAELDGDEEAAQQADYDRWMAKAAAYKATMDKEKEAGTWGEGMNGLYTYEEEQQMLIDYNEALLEAKNIKEDMLDIDKESNDELKKTLRAQGYLTGLEKQGYTSASTSLIGVNKILEGYNLPSYDTGIDIVPFDQYAYLHEGERVMTAKANAEYMRGLDRNYQTTTNVITENNIDNKSIAINVANASDLDNKLKTYGINGVKELAVIAKKNR